MENRKEKDQRLICRVMFCALAVALAVAVWPATGPLRAQSGAAGSNGQSLPEVIEAIEKARVTTRILYVTAHPDDEPGAVLAYLARGLHADVALLSLTRGEGGQNALGPEQAPQLGIIRTEELMNATRVYGTRLYFTRAADFGFTKTADEALKVWGDEVLEDMVRVIRTFQPHVIINSWGGVHSGHGQHQATGILTPKAYAMAADPNAFPEQIKERLQPWKAEALLQISRGDTSGGFAIPVSEISPLWGKSWGEIGIEGYLNHRTQGVGGVRSSPFFRRAISLVAVEGAKPDAALLGTPLGELMRRFPDLDDAGFFALMKKVDEGLGRAELSARGLDWKACVEEIARAAHELERTPFNHGVKNREEKEIAIKEMRETMRQMDAALGMAAGIRIDAQAERSGVVAGESFTVTVNWLKRNDVPVEIEGASLALPEGWSVTKEEKQPVGGVRFTVAIPKDAGEKSLEPQMNADEHRFGRDGKDGKDKDNAEEQRAQRKRGDEGGKSPAPPAPLGTSGSWRYEGWIYPWPAALVKAKLKAKVEGYEFETEAEVTATRVTSVSAETRPLLLVPAVTLTVEPKTLVLVSSGARGVKATGGNVAGIASKLENRNSKIGGERNAGAQPIRQSQGRQAAPLQSGVQPPHSKAGDLPVAPTEPREIVVRVRHYATAAEKITVGIEAPQGWTVSANGGTEEPKDEKTKSENRKAKIGEGAQQAAPLQSGVKPPHSKTGDLPVAPTRQDTKQTAKRTTEQTVEFGGAGDQLVRFTVRAPGKIAALRPGSGQAGKYELKAYAKRADGEEFRTSLEPLVTLPTRMWSEPAVARVHVMDVTVPKDLRVGYVAAENDLIPQALREIGVHVELLDEAALAFGDLSKYDAIAIGIRAYELRSDLARANQRLLDYAAAGGTLVVQYQREGVWNQLKPAPYAATIGGSLRTTDENSPVRILEPTHPVLNFPNAIRIEDYSGWVQERGLYYWDKFDAKYTPVLAMKDPGEAEALGALVYARHGKGVYIYTGLSFFRQLPEGVPGAYRLFVNLLAQGKKKAVASGE